MRALVVTGGKPIESVIDPPQKPEAGWVEIEVARCGICGSDIHMVDSGVVPDSLVMGHEISGTVVRIGDGVAHLAEGDRVAVLPAKVCDPAGHRVCGPCSRGESQRCEQMAISAMGITVQGGYAERVVAPASSCRKLSRDLDFDSAALIEPLAVAVHGVGRVNLDDRSKVGVVGGGPIGLLTALAASALSSAEVVVAEPASARREVAEQVGVASVADASQFLGKLGRAPDVVFECAGRSDTPAVAIQSVRAGGNVVILGVTDVNETLKIPSLVWVMKEVTVTTAIAYSRQEFDRAASLVEDGVIDVSPLVSSVCGLSEFDMAVDRLRSGEAMKILLSPGD